MKNITPVLLIIISIGLFYWQINPMYTTVKQLRVESSQYDSALETANQLKTVRGELSNKLAEFSAEDLDRLDKFLPKHLDVVRLVINVNGIATRAGLKLKDIKTGSSAFTASPGAVPQDKSKIYSPTTLSFGLETSYPNFIQFIKDVEQSLRLTDVTAISLSQGDKKSGQYNFSVTLQSYYLN